MPAQHLPPAPAARGRTVRIVVRLFSDAGVTPMPASRQSFYIGIPDLAAARGKIDALSFSGNSAETFAAELQAALRQPDLWERWKAMQPDPDAIDPALGASDPQASVS